MLALAGAERTGKSTLARAFAEKEGITYVPSRAGEVFRSFGFPVGPLPVADRCKVQDAILDAYAEDISRISGPWIADRTPLDMLAYTLLDLDGTQADADWVENYIERVMRVTDKLVPFIVVVQPGIPFVEEEGKWPRDPAHQEAMNYFIRGAALDARLRRTKVVAFHRGLVDLQARIVALRMARDGWLKLQADTQGEQPLH